MAIKIRRDNDPFKKYWWVILAGFILSAGWVCLPLLDSGTGSSAVVRDQGLKTSEQSLDAAANPVGAPGSAVDLAMDGAYRRKGADGMTSSLYQAPPEAAAAGAPVAEGTAGGDSSLANALKDISQRPTETAASDSDSSGWGGEKAQAGFTAAKANFGALSGTGGGSGSAASSGASGGPAASGGGTGSFGATGPKTGLATTKGLDEAAPESQAGSASMRALQSAASVSVGAANQVSMDGAKGGGGQSFDGGGAAGGSVGGPSGGGAVALSGGSGVYGKLDSAPVNLKINDPNLQKFDSKPPPAKAVAPPKQSMADMIMQMFVQAMIGGIVNGVVGAALGGLTPAKS